MDTVAETNLAAGNDNLEKTVDGNPVEGKENIESGVVQEDISHEAQTNNLATPSPQMSNENVTTMVDDTPNEIGPQKAQTDEELTSTLDATISSSCNVCRQVASFTRKKSGRTALTCFECKSLVHYVCARLPPYELHNYINTKKRYVCEICSDAPESFLTELIGLDIANVQRTPVERESILKDPERIAQIETKLDGLCETIEKYQISSLADRITTMYQQMSKVNKEFGDNINIMNKTKNALEKICQRQAMPPSGEENGPSNEKLSKLAEALGKSVSDKDELISKMAEMKEKHIVRIDQLHCDKQKLQSEVQRLSKIEEEKATFQSKSEKLEEEVTRLNSVILSIQTGKNERERDLDLQCQNLRQQLDSKTEDVKQLLTAFGGLQTSITNLADKHTPSNTSNAVNNTGSPETEADSVPSPKVVLFHDSLCKPINESIMSREKVDVKKVWAPTMAQTRTAVEQLEDTPDCIVVQGLTRHVEEKDPAEHVNDVGATVEKCLEKVGKVVLSLIVDREDSPVARSRAKAVNGLLYVKYMEEPRVILCEHENLRDSKNRRADKLHLNDMGTSKLATNLKYKIAEALGVTVVKKPRNDERGRYRSNNWNGGGYRHHNRGYTGSREGRGDRYDDQYDGRYNMYEDYD